MKPHWLRKSNWRISSSTVLVVMMTIIIVIGAYSLRSKIISTESQQTDRPETNQLDGVQPSLAPIKVEFEYLVTDITTESIVLAGQTGEFILPNDSNLVELYKGSDTTSPIASLSSLKTGDSVNVEFIPGQSAKLFLVSTE